MKKIISLILTFSLIGCCVLSGCADNSESSNKGADSNSSSKSESIADPIENISAEKSNDKYRNYYQIFVNSFCDSNGDGIGDLEGIISQLDYLNDGDPNTGDDLGIDGIWLTPIMPSKSYHKYDVEDYYDIDPIFGSLETFDKLIDECDKRGIDVIIDLVLNHISSENQLYLDAVAEVEDNKLDGKAEYFEIHKEDYFSADTNVNILANGYACEANFSPDMPEWNLNSEKTREEFKKIAKFWFDRGVAGFRLDACKYYTNKETDGEEFLEWFYSECKKMKPDVYMVGEDWEDDPQIQNLYKSGIDSLFAFKFSQTTGLVLKNMMSQNGSGAVSKFKRYYDKMLESNPNMINASFLSNHDQVRIGNTLSAWGPKYEKFAASVYMLLPGNSFTYYGEEIGMTSPDTTSDAYYRTGMIFDSENLPMIYVNGMEIEQTAPAGGGVKQQLKNDDSLLNFYRRVIKIKNQNPEIARGKITATEDFGDISIGAYYTEYEGSKLLIIHNFNTTDSKELTITDDMIKNPEVRADLVTDGADKHIEMKDGKITLPAQSTVILKAA